MALRSTRGVGSELECCGGGFGEGVLRCAMGRGLQSWRRVQPSTTLLYKVERREEGRGGVSEIIKPGGREFARVEESG